MKKVLIALAVTALSLASSPALAQNANDMMYLQRMNDPAYRAAVVSPQVHAVYGYGSPYAYGYNYVPPVGYAAGPQQDTTCVQAFIVSYCSSHPERPQVAQTCVDGAGHLFALDANKHWYYVDGSTGASMNVGEVKTQCPFSSYEATATVPTQGRN